jgi:Protein of unknown function (DUF2550)
MPTALVSAEIAVGVLLLIAVLFLSATYARRRAISRGRMLILCGWRANRRNGWRWGHIRLGATRLEWYSLLGLSPRPRHEWDRNRLHLDAPREIRRADRIDLIPDAAPVQCSYAGETFDLALTPGAYTALRSWAEASPPGTASLA